MDSKILPSTRGGLGIGRILSPSVHSQISSPKRHSRARGARRQRTVTISREGGMYVPSDSFGGISPERKASHAMIAFFTFVAVRIVQAQLGGSGREALGSYNAKSSKDLQTLLEEMPLKDGDAWIAALMRKNELLGVRVMEVRASYAKNDFEWGYMEKISVQELEKRNMQLMRRHAEGAFGKAFQHD